MDHIQAELDRISEKLRNYPHPNEHAGLFAAQQALEWARNPTAFQSPFLAVTGSSEDSGDCSGETRLPPLSDTSAQTLDESSR